MMNGIIEANPDFRVGEDGYLHPIEEGGTI